MVDFVDAAIGAAQSWLCRGLDTAETINGYFDRLTVSGRGVGLPVTPIAEPIRNFGRYLYQCPASGGPYPPQPVGIPGQCPGVSYRIDGEADVLNASGGILRTYGYVTNMVGPLPEFILTFNANNVLVVDQGGTVLGNLGTTPSGTANVEWQNGYPTITRNDGSPEEACDNPSVGSPPDVTYDDPDGNPVTEPVSIGIGDPVLLPDGDIIIPVTVMGPGWEVRVDLSGRNPPSVVPPGTPVGDRPCCPNEEPDDDVPPGDEPEPPDGDRLISGAFVVVNQADTAINSTQILVADGPTLHFPRLGSVIFGVKKGNSRAWINPVNVQTRRAFIPVPDGESAIAVRAQGIPGVSLSISPVYARITESETNTE